MRERERGLSPFTNLKNYSTTMPQQDECAYKDIFLQLVTEEIDKISH